MTGIFLKVFNMSISASWIVLAVIILRLLLKKAPKWITVLLWGIVAVRLICPFAVESPLSLIPSAQTIQPDVLTDAAPEISTGIPIVNHAIDQAISEAQVTLSTEKTVDMFKLGVMVFSRIWICGVVAMLLYMVISYLRLKKRVCTAVLLSDNVFLSENVPSPFALGIFKPRIYLPCKLAEADANYVIAHEKAHIRRGDHLIKPLGFILLAVNWFNPVIWIGYVLLCRDIEYASDEKVIKELNTSQRADYSQVLLNLSCKRSSVSACPLAFGQEKVKNRVRAVLNYKKPAFWLIIIAIVICVAVGVCFLTDPPQSEDTVVIPKPYVNTQLEGVYLTVKSVDINSGGYEVFNLMWHNDTEKQVTYGEMYSIEYYNGSEWVSVEKKELYFTLIGILLEPNSTNYKSYTTQNFDISKTGDYRIITSFSTDDGKSYYTYVEFYVREKDDTGTAVGGVDGPESVVITK